MIIIADSGSTKTDWCVVTSEKEQIHFSTEGYNPYFVGEEYIVNSIRNSFPAEIDIAEINEVHFYGAGCQEDEVDEMLKILKAVFFNARTINAEVDLLAAARGLLGNEPGFAAILGTGTNTCLYDGSRITQNIDSLGFMLGDEGSGAMIGKRILSDFLREKMPLNVKQAFIKRYGFKSEEIMHKVYKEPQPNRFCANFTKFLTQPEMDKAYVYQVVRDSFSAFFQNLVSCYPRYEEYAFNVVGSIGYYFKDTLEEVVHAYNMRMGTVIISPIRELTAYHMNKQHTLSLR